MSNHTLTVAFQGEHGAYSEQAAMAHFQNARTIPSRAIRDVFKTVESGQVNFGIVPAENSLEGSVNQTYDMLLESTLKIGGEIKIKVAHCLVTEPGTTMSDLKTVYSHPQALAQCSNFLDRLQVETIPAYDTAGSARMISEKKLRGAGAIASEKAADLYGLTILQRNIEDYTGNFTRFFVIGKEDVVRTGTDKTSVVFGTRHIPGSLHRALSEIAIRRINLTKIESRPTRTTPWEYHFFIDFEGHRTDRICAEALEAMKESTTFLKILGSYVRAD
jgi:chorismate mutase/prephenate dehydratase